MDILYKTIFGSHLYGTNLPDSDTDYKIVYLPSKRDLFLSKPLKNSVYQTNTQGKNTSVDEDVEHIPLHKLIVDFVKGQTYAIELVFSPGIDKALVDLLPAPLTVSNILSYDFARLCINLRTKCLTRDVTALVGYCKGQAKRYSSKGDKVNALKSVLDVFIGLPQIYTGNERLNNIRDFLPTHDKYLKFDTDDLGNEYYNVCGSQHQMSITIFEANERIKKQYEQYGNRAQEAAKMEGADWKAIMHACRVTMEAEELLTEHKVTFPFTGERQEYLLSVRKGEQTLDDVSQWLEDHLQIVADLEEKSTLPTQAEAMVVAEDLLYDFVLNHAN